MLKNIKKTITGITIAATMAAMSATGVFAANTAYYQNTTKIDNSVVGEYQSVDINSTTMVGENNTVFDYKSVDIGNSVLGRYSSYNIKNILAAGKNNTVVSSDDFSVKDSVAGTIERVTQNYTQLIDW